MQDGHKVCLLETYPQGTVSNLRARRTQVEPLVETVSAGNEIDQKLRMLDRRGVTLTIIDTAGGDNDVTTAAINAAYLCLIPARPSPTDIEAALPTLTAVRNLNKPFAFVLNQTPVRGNRIDHASAALSEKAVSLNLMGVLALPYIVLRNDHQDALGAVPRPAGIARGGLAPRQRTDKSPGLAPGLFIAHFYMLVAQPM